MNRLTHERRSGIKIGYWSPAKKEELVQCLGAYEKTGLEPEEIISRLNMHDGSEPPPHDGRYLVIVQDMEAVYEWYWPAFAVWNRHEGWDVQEVVWWMPLPKGV